ncbi:MAG: aminopeptidase P N-terminal domain-containing protein, partial [Lapillicoccus sp.]
MSEEQKQSESRARPITDELRSFISSGWSPRPSGTPGRAPVADFAASRRGTVSEQFPGERLVVPAGGFKVRSNDTDYVFRPHSAFAHLTGFGSDEEPDAVLVLEPRSESAGGGHDAVLYFRPWGGRDGDEFFSDSRYGEFWVGARPTLEDIEAEFGLAARHIDELKDAVGKDAGHVGIRVVRDADAEVAAVVDEVRDASTEETTEAHRAAALEQDEELEVFLSTLRLVKDEWEIEQMKAAVAATHLG